MLLRLERAGKKWMQSHKEGEKATQNEGKDTGTLKMLIFHKLIMGMETN